MGKGSENAKCYILQDGNTIDNLESCHFDAAFWESSSGFGRIEGGRGGSVKIEINGCAAVLRPYRRGGLVSRVSSDQYVWLGKNRTRPWREWKVLQHAISLGLPVPRPLGACVWQCRMSYRAAIITAYLDQTETLMQRLSHRRLNEESWFQLGRLLKRFQGDCFRHADLNANNILINQKDQFFIIDFDRACIMKRMGDWQWIPLNRLQGSLEKLNRQQELNYLANDWRTLMHGYG